MRASKARPERLRIAVAIAFLAVVNAGAWLMLVAGSPTSVAFTAAALLSYGLGLRHGLDADHIAAIDDTTRMLVGRGQAPVGTGLYFALGHSVVVLALGAVVALASQTLSDQGAMSVGAWLSSVLIAGFLFTVGTLNLISLRDMAAVRRSIRSGPTQPGPEESGSVGPDQVRAQAQAQVHAQIHEVLAGRGLMNRIAGQRTQKLRSSRGMFVVGLIFGLGLGTASEIVVITAGAAVADPGLPWLTVMALPSLFVAGMLTTDTLDGIFMSRLYRSASLTPERSLDLALITTTLTVLIAFGVGAVYAADIAVRLGLDFLAPVAGLRSHFTTIGLLIVLAYAAIWGGCSLLWRAPAATPDGD